MIESEDHSDTTLFQCQNKLQFRTPKNNRLMDATENKIQWIDLDGRRYGYYNMTEKGVVVIPEDDGEFKTISAQQYAQGFWKEKIKSNAKDAVQFYVNYEFEDQPVNGFDQWTEDQFIEVMEAYYQHKLDSVSDDVIEKKFPERIKNPDTGNLIKSPINFARQHGAKWLREHLKK